MSERPSIVELEPSYTVQTVSLDFSEAKSLSHKIQALLRTIFVPYREHSTISKEYKSWVKCGLLDSLKRKMRFLTDHYLLWMLYCIMASCKGVFEGSKWHIRGIPKNPFTATAMVVRLNPNCQGEKDGKEGKEKKET